MNILPEFTMPALSLPRSLTDWVALARRWHFTPLTGLDLGDGRSLNAEDVLEGHFFRLANDSRPEATSASVSSPLPCYAYVRSDLGIAIATLAPHLSPLTELAEEMAQTVPPAHPSPQFRNNLQRALEQEHRQQTAKRMLVTQQQTAATRPLPQRLRSKPALIAGVPLLLGLLACVIWYQRDAKVWMMFTRSQAAPS